MRETELGPCFEAPALGTLGSRLALAWVDGDSYEIVVAIGPVPHGIMPGEEFSPTTKIATGFACPSGYIALATHESRLYLAWVDGARRLLTSRLKAGAFEPPVEVAAEVSGGVGAAANRYSLFLAWRTEGNQVMVTSGDDGVAFDTPTAVGHTSYGDPGLAIVKHPYHGETLLMTIAESGNRVLSAPVNYFPPLAGPGVEVGIDISGYVAITPTDSPVGSGPGLILAYRDGDDIALWNADLDLDLYGANPHGPWSRSEPAVAGLNGDLIVAYVEPSTSRLLRVGSWTSVFDIPPDLVSRIGKTCDPYKCTEDPRLICALTKDLRIEDRPARIANARAGDIVLTPADGEGVIGTILKALRPSEFYDHMGLMVEDYEVIRHCTEAKDRLMRDKDYFSGSLLGDPAPTDGLRPDLVKYGWPGPITQTVQNGFFDGWNDGLNPSWNHRELSKWAPQSSLLTQDQRRAFYDEEFPDKPARITNLTLTPARRDDHPEPLHPLVVRPSEQAEDYYPWVRWALGRVIAEARRTEGHYRFYAYTDATVGTDPGRFAPPADDPSWDGLPKGADWAAGTPGLVCSTFVWAAATRAFAGLQPRLLLDADSSQPQDGSGREQAGDKIDGLYAFFEPERTDAAHGLHGWIVKTVQKTVKQEVDKRWEATLARLGVSILIGLLTGVLLGPIAGVAAGLFAGAQLSSTQEAELLSALTDMPDQVANGICNAFAHDRPDRVDDTDWESPGAGLTVSPDNIWSFWDAPVDHDEFRAGLWGTSVQAMLANPRPEVVEVGTLQLSPGVCHVSGRVEYGGKALLGAEVFVGCHKAVTDVEGGFSFDVPANEAGQEQLIRAQANWQQPPGMLTAKLRRSLPPGWTDVGTIKLDPPPEWRRRIEVYGELVMSFHVLLGEDTIDHHRFARTFFLQADPELIEMDPGRGVASSTCLHRELTDRCGEHRGRLSMTMRVLNSALDGLQGVPPRPPGAADLSLVVDWAYEMVEDDDEKVKGEEIDDVRTGTLVIPPGESGSLVESLHDAEVPPNTAYANVVFENQTNPA